MKKKYHISANVCDTNSDGHEELHIIQTSIWVNAKHGRILLTRLNNFHFDFKRIGKQSKCGVLTTVLSFQVYSFEIYSQVPHSKTHE